MTRVPYTPVSRDNIWVIVLTHSSHRTLSNWNRSRSYVPHDIYSQNLKSGFQIMVVYADADNPTARLWPIVCKRFILDRINRIIAAAYIVQGL